MSGELREALESRANSDKLVKMGKFLFMPLSLSLFLIDPLICPKRGVTYIQSVSSLSYHQN